LNSQRRDILAEPWIPKFDEQVLAPTDDQAFPRRIRPDPPRERETANLSLPKRHSHRAVVNACRWSPDGNLVATAGGEGLIRLFDIRTFKELEPLKGHKEPVVASACEEAIVGRMPGERYEFE
jgi:WD40 repeat protein